MSRNPASVLFTVSGVQLAVQANESITTSGISGFLVAGSDGSVVRYLKVNNDGSISVNDNGGSVTVDNAGTFATQATQAGVWNLTNISGTITLPTGASTSALQTTGNSSLSSIDGKTPALGQALMAASVPVVIASNQSAIPVTGTFFQATQPVSGTVTVTQATGTNLHTVIDSGTVTTVSTVTNLSQLAGNAISMNTGVRDTGTQRVTIATNDSVPVTGTFFQVTQPVSIAASVAVTGPLTDTQLRATPVPVSGTITANAGTGNFTVVQASAANLNATITGTVSVSNFPATQPVSGTVSAIQSGTWNVNNISGTVSLPTGASTSALQTTGNSSLSSIDTKIPALGQALMTASVPVVIASNQSAIPVSGTVTVVNASVSTTGSSPPGSATFMGAAVTTSSPAYTTGQMSALSLSTIGALRTDQTSWFGSTAPTIGQKSMANSIPVVFPSDQTISVTTAPSSSIAGFNQGDVTTAATTQTVVRSTAYTEQTTNAQRSIVSSSALDTALGTGARTVKITYYDSTGAGPSTEIVTLNGILPVNTISTTICFIEKIEVVTVGTTGSNAGTISLKAAIAGAGVTIGTITALANTTLWAHHYVPTGKVCNITTQWAGHDGTTVGSGGTFIIKSLPIGVVNAAEVQISDKFRLYGQSSSTQRSYGSPIKITGPARLVTYVTPETSTSTNYRASFDFYEV
jgi:hypothetical protein